MSAPSSLRQLENKLVRSMRNDRTRKSNLRRNGDTIIVQSSGLTVGLALAVELRTNETFDQIMERLVSEV